MRLLKFDTPNPWRALDGKINAARSQLATLGRKEMLEWLLAQRCNYSDYITYALQKYGWDAEEYVLQCELYDEKVWRELFPAEQYHSPLANSFCKVKRELVKTACRGLQPAKKISPSLANFLNTLKRELTEPCKPSRLDIVAHYIQAYKPSVVFVREHSGIASRVWSRFGKDSLLVSMLASPLPEWWHPRYWDLVLTSSTLYKDFFESQGTPAYLVPNAFDGRVLQDVPLSERDYPLVFIGNVGVHWKQRTALIEQIAQSHEFLFWGHGVNTLDATSALRTCWKGVVTGLEMYKVYGRAKIAVNDYIDMAVGNAVNQRIYEIMGMGALMLTRESATLRERFPDDTYVSYVDKEDCLRKIEYFLRNDQEREDIAKNGQRYILENCTYDALAKQMDSIFRDAYAQKYKC